MTLIHKLCLHFVDNLPPYVAILVLIFHVVTIVPIQIWLLSFTGLRSYVINFNPHLLLVLPSLISLYCKDTTLVHSRIIREEFQQFKIYRRLVKAAKE